MIQPIPMPDLVRRRAPQVVTRERAAGHRRAEDVAPVGHVRGRRRLGRHPSLRRQRAEAQQRRARGHAGRGGRRLQLRLEVDVQRAVGAGAQREFHAGVVGGRGPGVVDAARDAAEAEGDAGVGVGLREVGELVCDHGVGYVVRVGGGAGVSVGHDVEVGVDCVVRVGGLALMGVGVSRVVGVHVLMGDECGGVPEVVV